MLPSLTSFPSPTSSVTSQIHEDYLNCSPTFGISSESRGLPTLRWDNSVSKDMFKFKGMGKQGGSRNNDTNDAMNGNYKGEYLSLSVA